MEIYKLKDMKGGWYIGDFIPSVFRTKLFEVSLKTHPKNEEWPTHYHKEAMEINLLVKGKLRLNDVELIEGDIFVMDKMEVVNPIFEEDCLVVCVKVPSVIGDKYIVEN